MAVLLHILKRRILSVYQHSLLTICLNSTLLIIIFDAVSCLTHAIKSYIDKGCKGFKAVFLDFSNIYLIHCHVKGYSTYWLVKWVHNYFTGRSQYIRVHNKFSSTSQITAVLFKAQFFSRSFSLLTPFL